LTNPEASRVRSYDVSIISYVETNQAKPYSLSIEPQKVRYDNTTIYGIIENNGYVAANKTMVYATFYDKDGTVVDMSSTDPGTVEDIPKAQNTWFMIGHYVLSNIFERARWFSLTAECLQYSLEKETGLLRFLPPPFVIFSVDPGTNVTTGQMITFNATGSHASENRTVISYKWDFGDNTTGEGMVTSHFYDAVGNYTVELTIKDNEGLDALAEALVLRQYASINRQEVLRVDAGHLVFRMNECRVQTARKRKGLPDFPCKSVGLVEYAEAYEVAEGARVGRAVKTEPAG
jgi:PKD repeat protein